MEQTVIYVCIITGVETTIKQVITIIILLLHKKSVSENESLCTVKKHSFTSKSVLGFKTVEILSCKIHVSICCTVCIFTVMLLSY
jgi:hypothetical protein